MYSNLIIEAINIFFGVAILLYCIDNLIKVIKFKYKKTMKNFILELKKSVNWTSYWLYVILFNLLLLLSNWNIETFILLNMLFIFTIFALYFVRKSEMKTIERKSEIIHEELDKELNLYDLNMVDINNQKRNGHIGIDEYENLIKKERTKLIKYYIDVINKNI